MLNLTKEEKLILVFLIFSFTVGAGISIYKKSHQELKLIIKPYRMEQLALADKFIQEKRSVNINSFKSEELKRLPGIGEKLAQRIAAYHKLHGPFKQKEELLRVKGVGKKKFENFKDLIVLE